MKSNHKLARIIIILFGLLIINYGCQKENTEIKNVEPLDENYISHGRLHFLIIQYIFSFRFL